jgi:genome maintenance exonuclease 1
MKTHETPIGKLASVTTILRATEDEKAKDRLRKWQHKQDKIYGVEQANNNSDDRLNRGKEIHAAIENLHKFNVEPAENWVHEGNAQRWKHLQPFLKSIKIMECERFIWHNSGYAGTADLVAIMDDQPTLLDWKTSDRIKKRQWIDEAFIQTAAYAKAWNFSALPTQDSPAYLNDITQLAVIVISPEKLQIFTENNIKKYEKLWDERLLKFQKLGIIIE